MNKKIWKKSQCRNKLKGGIFWHPFCRKFRKKIEGGPFGENVFPKKKSRNAKKTERGILWSRPVLYVTRETFLVQFLGPTGTIWRLLKCL